MRIILVWADTYGIQDFSGAHEQSRTADLILTKNVLCQLSYVGLYRQATQVPPGTLHLYKNAGGEWGAPRNADSVIRLIQCLLSIVCRMIPSAVRSKRYMVWAEKDSNLRRAKPDWFTASSDWPLRHLPGLMTGSRRWDSNP